MRLVGPTVLVAALLLGAGAAAALAPPTPGGAAPAGASDTSPTDAEVQARLRAALEADLATDRSVPGEALAVRAPGLSTTLAAGAADTATGTPLAPDTPFRVASMTKTFVAAAVLRLVEQGKVELEAPITRYLSHGSLRVLRADGYRVGRITVRELLQHTSGIYDYAMDDAYDADNVAHPHHRWTRAEQLRFATRHGDPLGRPGTVYAYADTNYILLGELIERVTDEPLPAAVRSLLGFDRLGLDHTYWEILEPTPPGTPPRAHQYYDTYDNIVLDASQDLYGGGGLVSTVDDLAAFYRALFHGEVFDRPSTLRTMTTVSRPGRDEGAAMGIFAVDSAGERCYGHAGYWGTQTIHCPRLDLTFARTINQADDSDFDYNALESVVVRTAKELSPG
jgi:D-alanyl-D-alanine carboxypeptidase